MKRINANKKALCTTSSIGVPAPFVLGLLAALEGASLWHWWTHFLYAIETVLLSTMLIYLSYTDFRWRIIPNWTVVAIMAIHSVFLLFSPTNSLSGSSLQCISRFFVSLLSGLSLGLLAYIAGYINERLFKRNSLGGGDIKLIAALGFVLGIELALYALLIACLFALLGIALGKLMKLLMNEIFSASNSSRSNHIRSFCYESSTSEYQETQGISALTFAFGPALAFGMELCLLIGA